MLDLAWKIRKISLRNEYVKNPQKLYERPSVIFARKSRQSWMSSCRIDVSHYSQSCRRGQIAVSTLWHHKRFYYDITIDLFLLPAPRTCSSSRSPASFRRWRRTFCRFSCSARPSCSCSLWVFGAWRTACSFASCCWRACGSRTSNARRGTASTMWLRTATWPSWLEHFSLWWWAEELRSRPLSTGLITLCYCKHCFIKFNIIWVQILVF